MVEVGCCSGRQAALDCWPKVGDRLVLFCIHHLVSVVGQRDCDWNSLPEVSYTGHEVLCRQLQLQIVSGDIIIRLAVV